MKYICNVCGFVYDEAEQDVKWEDLPVDFVCGLCGVGKEDFSPAELFKKAGTVILQDDYTCLLLCYPASSNCELYKSA